MARREREHYRDIGNGKMRDDFSGRIKPNPRTQPREASLHALLSPERWEKLKALAEYRGKTPLECIEGFIDHAVTTHGLRWSPPSK